MATASPDGHPAAAPDSPVLFIVDADREARAATESALARRSGSDYRVLTADSPHAGLDASERLAHRGAQVALLAADLHLPAPPAATESAEDAGADLAADRPALQEVEGEQETASGG